jgi:RHS repeat-associated protein
VYTSGTSLYVAFGSASGYGTPVNTGIAGYIALGNLNGGAEDGILSNHSGTFYYYTWNGTSFVGTSTGAPFDANVNAYQLADIDGDGLPDIVAFYETPDETGYDLSITVRFNTGHGSAVTFATTATTGYSRLMVAGAELVTPSVQFGPLHRFDFNGDGREDLALIVKTGTPPDSYIMSTYALMWTGSAFSRELLASIGGALYTNPMFANWNDDACTDIIQANYLYLSACNGSAGSVQALGAVVAAMDWDGDGRTDIVVANGTTLGVYLSTGSGLSSLISTSVPYTSTCQYLTMDVKGDGLTDLGCWSQAGAKPLIYYAHNGTGQPPDLVSAIKDGYGNSASPTYVSIAQSNYTEHPSSSLAPTFPDIAYIGPMYVVSEVAFSDPSSVSGTYNQTFDYYAAWMNLQGRGFEGFQTLYTADSRTPGLSRYQYFEQQFPWTWMKYTDLLTTSVFYPTDTVATPNTLAEATLSSTANEQRYFPYFTNVTTTKKELGGAENGDLIATTSANYTYDTYGNATTVATTETDNDPGSPYVNDTWTSTTVNTITPNTADWCLNLPTTTTVTNSSTAAGGAAITRTVNYTPDYTNCRETQRVMAPSTAYQVTEAYGFDSFGNANSDAVTGTGMAARTTSVNWGTTGQFATTITNPLGQIITSGYDPASGRLTSRTDPNSTAANPIVTSWSYDSFFRKAQETRPDGTYTTWSYNDCASAGGCLFGSNALTLVQNNYASNAALLNSGTTYFDQIDRPVMATATMLSGSLSRTDTRYDPLGRVAQQSMPCIYSAVATPCTYWTTNTYDVLNRVTQSQRPISSTNSTLQTTAFGYAGRTTTVTDPLNNTTTKINLVTGAMARSKDPKGYYQNFTYDAFGSLLSVTDSASPAHTLSTATYHYGIQPFKTASTDVDMGARSYTVDPLGEVTTYSDAKSQNFSMTYDALSRPLVRTEPDLTTTWTWGSAAASYNIGKLHSVTAASSVGTYSDTYTYDSRTRLSSELTSNPGDRTYNYIWTYNPTTGQLSSLQYPVDISFILTLQYAYSNGILQSISSNSYTPTEVFWTANATNPRGQVTQETLGNGAVINRTFDAVTGWLGNMQAGVGGGATLQNNSYAYDDDGDVTQRQDDNRGLTENFYYDTLNRLDHSALNGSPNLQMTYDAVGMGNIASRSDVAAGAAWTYDPVHIHQVTQAGSASNGYVYDANGNVTSRNGYAVTWSSYNYPTGVNSAGESVTFQYGPNRERWQEIYTGPNGVEKTNRAGKLFEVAIYGGLAHYRHYIYAGNELVAVDDRTTAASPLYYIVGDHQGGIASIENSANPGTNFVSESFTAFGMRRSGETWSGPVTAADETAIDGVSRHGYTNQSVLGVNMYLNHMNGRIQDAITGRFLSPDPNVPDPGNTQSWNRYSYVNNNPLTFTDPTGFRIGKPVCKDFCPNFSSGYANLPSIESTISTVSSGLTFSGGTFDDTDAALGIDPGKSGSATVGTPISPDNAPQSTAAQGTVPLSDPADTSPSQGTPPGSSDTPASDAQQTPVLGEDTTGAGQNAQRAVDAINAQAALLQQAWDALQKGQSGLFDYNDFMSQAAQQLQNYYKYCGCSAPSP